MAGTFLSSFERKPFFTHICFQKQKTGSFFQLEIDEKLNEMAGLAAKASGLVGELATQARPALAKFLYYAKVELIPPKPNEIGAIKDGIQNIITGATSGRWKQLTVKEGFLNTLVAVEVACWFYVGECIGKRHLVGYDV